MSENLSQNLPWLGRRLTVVDSPDSSLVGRTGRVIDETMRTVAIDESFPTPASSDSPSTTDYRKVVFGKAAIKFQLDDEKFVIDGSKMQFRPEDRINRRFKAEPMGE
jgi:RNase P/RNase MRP subunit p29